VARRCTYCGATEEQTGHAHVGDHFIPSARGGADGKANFVLACHQCNAAKSDRVFASIEEGRVWLHVRFWLGRRRRHIAHRAYAFGGKPPSADAMTRFWEIDQKSRSRPAWKPKSAPAPTKPTVRPQARSPFVDEVATGKGTAKLRIVGRPREGAEETYVILEEPGDPVLMHYRDRLVPHFKADCPHCDGTDEPKPMVYVGATTLGGELAILELSWKCFQSAGAAARKLSGNLRGLNLFGEPIEADGRFTGLMVRISRANFRASPRVLRCDQRAKSTTPWQYRTREELARIWGIPVKPRLFRAEDQA